MENVRQLDPFVMSILGDIILSCVQERCKSVPHSKFETEKTNGNGKKGDADLHN